MAKRLLHIIVYLKTPTPLVRLHAAAGSVEPDQGSHGGLLSFAVLARKTASSARQGVR